MTAERAAKILFAGEKHETDPKLEILAAVGDAVQCFSMLGSRVLVAIYVRPEKSAGGILRPSSNRDEDKWQGKVGLVVAKGPLAFTESDTHHWGDAKPNVGDWVMFRVGDTFPFALGPGADARNLRIVEDVNVHAILSRPDVAW